MATLEGYECAYVEYDEEDIVGKKMLDWFEWDTASIFDIIGDEDYDISNVDVDSNNFDVFND